jgi:hypothetical protein
MLVVRRAKTGKRKRYQGRDDGTTKTMAKIIEIRYMPALLLANKLSSLLLLFYPLYS